MIVRLATLGAFAMALLPVAAASAHSSGASVTVQARIIPGKIVEQPGKIILTPNHVKAGSVVTFVITNTDKTNAHVFQANGRMTRFIPSGGQRILRNVSFPNPGSYVVSCPDADRGIGARFTVTS